MHFAKSVLIAASFLAVTIAQGIQITRYPNEGAVAGEPTVIGWAGGDGSSTITISLQQGGNTLSTILQRNGQASTFTWTPSNALPNGDYSIEITQGSSTYSTPSFALTGGQPGVSTMTAPSTNPATLGLSSSTLPIPTTTFSAPPTTVTVAPTTASPALSPAPISSSSSTSTSPAMTTLIPSSTLIVVPPASLMSTGSSASTFTSLSATTSTTLSLATTTALVSGSVTPKTSGSESTSSTMSGSTLSSSTPTITPASASGAAGRAEGWVLLLGVVTSLVVLALN